jgi:hypothetical protein
VIKWQEPARLMQVEAIREHATRVAGARASGDNAAIGSATQAMLGLVAKFMADVDMEMVDGLDPDTTRAWREQVYEIVSAARLDQPSSGGAGVGAGPPAPVEASDHLAPLKSAIKLATHTMEAVAREIQDPDEITLRGFGKHLGNLKKEIMTLSRNLVAGQLASMATEATRMADEASEAIKASRESIRAALRGLGAASDISEASGPHQGSAAAPDEVGSGKHGLGVGDGHPTSSFRVATRPHAGHHSVAPHGVIAEAQDKGSRRGTVSSHARHDERSGK